MDAESASPVEASSPRTPDELFAQVYARLKAMASRQRRGGASADTLNTTALVHELYIKLNQGRELSFADQAQFFAYAARALRADAGRLGPDSPGDLVVWDAEHYRQLCQHMGVPLAVAVYRDGRLAAGSDLLSAA